MLFTILVLTLTQTAAAPPSDAPIESDLTPYELPRPLNVRAPPPPDYPVRRFLLTTAGGLGGAAAGLGLSLALTSCFTTCVPKFDVSFANTALSGLLIAGVGFAVHQALGGRGEVTLPTLASLAIMVAASLVAPAVNPGTPQVQMLTTAFGALPAAAAVALILDATASMNKGRSYW